MNTDRYSVIGRPIKHIPTGDWIRSSNVDVREVWDLQSMADSVRPDAQLPNRMFRLHPFTRPLSAWKN